ncbi:sugar transferase [Bacillus sp. NPDC077027]|uniref:sugar transferase n=1 Tax=Bacillus sp. NPDC077027 TaxID=3390548 RepID=UPI003CFBE7A2
MSAEKAMNLYRDFEVRRNHSFALTEHIVRYLFAKRLIDFVLSFIGAILSTPIILLFAILIKLETPGPAFYIQERVGKDGIYFRLWKLRSMRIDAENGGAKWAQKNDPRVTRIGSFIRKTRIDELPQFINVLKGDMSIVGPRPERPMFTAEFNRSIPGFTKRLTVKPGLTGLAQVNGGYEMSPSEKLEYDLHYIQSLTFSLDTKIMVKTLKVIVTGDGAR